MGSSVPGADPGARQRLTTRFGSEAEAWFDELPGMLTALAERWQLELGSPIPRGSVSAVFRCRMADGRRTVLKASPDRARLAFEAAALDRWQTVHTPAVIELDEQLGALLIEAIEPGTPLVVSSIPQTVSETLQAFQKVVPASDMLAYLSMMAPRLVELQRVLRPTGSIYRHCDPTASHYLKLLMDAVFGPENFQNEVIWYYRGAGVSPRRWGRRHDSLLFYTKGSRWTFNVDDVRDEYAETTKQRFKHYIGNVRGEKDFGPQSLNPKGKHPDDVWQIPIEAPSAQARVGWPTQKPRQLLKRIILASTSEGDTVFDPFCGCGTTITVAHGLQTAMGRHRHREGRNRCDRRPPWRRLPGREHRREV